MKKPCVIIARKQQAWELQALIRSRSAAGASPLYTRFAERGATAFMQRL